VPADDDVTLDDEMVTCPACAGSGRGQTTELVLGNGCIFCHGVRKVTASRAAEFRAVMDGEEPPK